MIRDGHLGVPEAYALFSVFVGTKVLLSLPQELAQEAHAAGWIVALIAGAAAVIGWLILAALMAPYQNMSLASVSVKTLGTFPGLIFNAGIVAVIMAVLAIKLRHYSDTIITSFLPTTPLSIVIGLYCAGAVYLAYSGLEALGRTALFFAPWIGGGIVLILIGAGYWYDASALFPLLGPGPGKLLWHGLFRSSIGFEIFAMAMVIPMAHLTRSYADTTRTIVLSLLTVFVVLAVVEIAFTMVLPYPLNAIEAFPLLEVARMIYWGRLIQHLEPIFLFIWVFAGVTNLGAGFYAISRVLADTLDLPVYRPLVFPLTIIAYALAFLPPTQPEAFHWDNAIVSAYGIIPGMIIPAVILILARWRGIKPNKTEGADRP